jgi:16S rRNA (guanine966-N2)-methyltransferase
LRIIGGEAKGRRLKAPQGAGTRPTADRVRETIFNILGQRLQGERVLDLYAGSGALGLEALSRGAAAAVLVERDRAAAAICGENAAALGYGGRTQVVRGEVAQALQRLPGPFQLVFVDPPYAEGPAAALQLLGELALVAPGGTVVAEHDKREETAERYGPLVRIDVRRFGDTAVSFFEHTPQEPA